MPRKRLTPNTVAALGIVEGVSGAAVALAGATAVTRG